MKRILAIGAAAAIAAGASAYLVWLANRPWRVVPLQDPIPGQLPRVGDVFDFGGGVRGVVMGVGKLEPAQIFSTHAPEERSRVN